MSFMLASCVFLLCLHVPAEEQPAAGVERERQKEIAVTIEGEVASPGSYRIPAGEKLGSLIAHAGGLTGSAWTQGIVLLRRSVAADERRELAMALDALDAALETLGGAGDAQPSPHFPPAQTFKRVYRLDMGSAPPGRESIEAGGMGGMRAALNAMRKAEPCGRVILPADFAGTAGGAWSAAVLEDGDRVTVPSRPATVKVAGAVYCPSVMAHREWRTIGGLIADCGGATPEADLEGLFVVRADGTVASRAQRGLGGFVWSPEEGRWRARDLMVAKPSPGDTVIVPWRMPPGTPRPVCAAFTRAFRLVAVKAGAFVAP
jgi:polysaccharide export outer membrane protein